MKTNMAISSQEREHIKNSRIFVKGGQKLDSKRGLSVVDPDPQKVCKPVSIVDKKTHQYPWKSEDPPAVAKLITVPPPPPPPQPAPKVPQTNPDKMPAGLIPKNGIPKPETQKVWTTIEEGE